jgi:zinc protease
VARFSSENDSASELATKYGGGLAVGRTMDQIDGWSDVISRVTADDVKRVAVTYLDARRSVTGWLLPATEVVEVRPGTHLTEAV